MQAIVVIPIIISVGLLITNIVSVCVAIHYKRKEYSAQVENIIELNNKLTVFLTREKMLEALHSMYTKANAGEIIWGQSVSGNIVGDVKSKIVDAATRGVKFEMIFSYESYKETSMKRELVELFKILKADVHIRDDNNVRVQGLSTKEVLVAIPTNTKYVSVLIKDETIVKIFREWFTNRFNSDNNK